MALTSTENNSSLQHNKNQQQQQQQQQSVPTSEINEQIQHLEQQNFQLNHFCKNCNQYPNDNVENNKIYNFVLIPSNSTLIKDQVKF